MRFRYKILLHLLACLMVAIIAFVIKEGFIDTNDFPRDLNHLFEPDFTLSSFQLIFYAWTIVSFFGALTFFVSFIIVMQITALFNKKYSYKSLFKSDEEVIKWFFLRIVQTMLLFFIVGGIFFIFEIEL